MNIENFSAIAYILASILFILSLKGLSGPESSRKGNFFGILAMAIAIITTILQPNTSNIYLIFFGIFIGGIIGSSIALKIEMTAMPQLVAAFHSLVGIAAVLVAYTALIEPNSYGIGSVGSIKIASKIEMSLGGAIGAVTFTGSIIAFGKLQGIISGTPVVFKGQHLINLLIGIALFVQIFLFVQSENHLYFHLIILLALLLGVLLIIPIGGADMPVVVSMLNSYSGWAAAGIGFTLQNTALIIVGALVGASGAILSYIMCRAMNRSFVNVILGGFGAQVDTNISNSTNKNVKPGSAEDAAFIMKNAENVIIVPGYGMAVAQAQHILREMTDILKNAGVNVKYAIHPVAGRMPGHMNVLLAEANVPYDEVFELEDINSDFSSADVAFVILEVEKSKTVLFVKRSLSPGYAGIDNKVFYNDNTMMLFDDAKKMLDKIVNALN